MNEVRLPLNASDRTQKEGQGRAADPLVSAYPPGERPRISRARSALQGYSPDVTGRPTTAGLGKTTAEACATGLRQYDHPANLPQLNERKATGAFRLRIATP